MTKQQSHAQLCSNARINLSYLQNMINDNKENFVKDFPYFAVGGNRAFNITSKLFKAP